MDSFGLSDKQTDSIPPVQKWWRSFRVEHTMITRNKVNCHVSSVTLKGQTGAGICISINGTPVEEKFTPYGKTPTSHQVSFMGCTETCERLERYSGMGEISIFIYHKATLDSLDCEVIKHGMALTAVLQLDHLAESVPVCLTNGDKKDPLMVRALSLAKQGALTPFETDQRFPVSNDYYKREVAAEVRRRCTLRWQSRKDARQARELWPNVDEYRSSLLYKSKRSEIGVLLGMYTGHNHYNRHGFLLGETVSPTCRLCSLDEEMALHILGQCPALSGPCYKFLGSELLDEEQLQVETPRH